MVPEHFRPTKNTGVLKSFVPIVLYGSITVRYGWFKVRYGVRLDHLPFLGCQIEGGGGQGVWRKAGCRFSCGLGLGLSLGLGIGIGFVFSHPEGGACPQDEEKTKPMPMPRPRLR